MLIIAEQEISMLTLEELRALDQAIRARQISWNAKTWVDAAGKP